MYQDLTRKMYCSKTYCLTSCKMLRSDLSNTAKRDVHPVESNRTSDRNLSPSNSNPTSDREVDPPESDCNSDREVDEPESDREVDTPDSDRTSDQTVDRLNLTRTTSRQVLNVECSPNLVVNRDPFPPNSPRLPPWELRRDNLAVRRDLDDDQCVPGLRRSVLTGLPFLWSQSSHSQPLPHGPGSPSVGRRRDRKEGGGS